MQENCIFLLSSVAKPIVTVAALRLIENGRMSLGDSVRRDVLGAVIEKATLQPLPQAVAELVLNPLDMKDTGFGIVDTRRLVVHYADGKPEPRRMTDDDQLNFFERPVAFSPVRLLDPTAFPSGGAGVAGTATDVLKFLETMIGRFTVDVRDAVYGG